MRTAGVRKKVSEQAARLALLGEWPAWVPSERAVVTRIPEGTMSATGFDPLVACALDLIPREKQRLSAIMQMAPTPEAAAQALREAAEMHPDSETCWWLAARYITTEEPVDEEVFLNQLREFRYAVRSPEVRQTRALRELATSREFLDMHLAR